MKKIWKLLAAVTACAAALCLTAAAAETTASVKVWGTVSPWDGEGIYLKNDDKDDPFHEVVVNLGDAPIVDAVTGQPLEAKDIKEGSTLYAWIGPAATMSLPPQVSAIVAVSNVPADAAVPEYYEIAGMPEKGENGEASFPVMGGGTLKVTAKTEYKPWLTRQIVRMEDLVPGTQVLVWKSGETAEKVVVFAYAYEGHLTQATTPELETVVFINAGYGGDMKGIPCKMSADGSILVPVRVVAEAAGYDVHWDKDLGAVVGKDGKTVFSVKPGAEVIQTADGEVGIASPCVLEKGVTYLPAGDLAHCLNLFFVG